MDVEVTGTAPEDWNRLVGDDPEGTFFHRTEWASLLVSSGVGSGTLYFVTRSGGEPVAGVQAVWIRRGPFRILASMPLGTYGALVLSPRAPLEAQGRLLSELARVASRPTVAAVHLMDEPGRIEDPPPGFSLTVERAHRIDLDAGFEAVWEGFKPSARNKVRKARKAGVTVRRGHSEGDYLEYHDMLEECTERWGERSTFGARFFSGLSALDGEMVQLWLAEHDGRAVGGDLNFALHGRIMNWGNVSRTDARSLAPNNLLHAAAMEEGSEKGATVYDLGSSAGIKGVDSFKAAFGTTLVPLRRYSLFKRWFRVLRSLSGRQEGGGAQ